MKIIDQMFLERARKRDLWITENLALGGASKTEDIVVDPSEVYALLYVFLTKGNQNKLAFYAYEITVDGETYGDESIPVNESKFLNFFHHPVRKQFDLVLKNGAIDGLLPGENGQTAVGYYIRARVYDRTEFDKITDLISLPDVL